MRPPHALSVHDKGRRRLAEVFMSRVSESGITVRKSRGFMLFPTWKSVKRSLQAWRSSFGSRVIYLACNGMMQLVWHSCSRQQKETFGEDLSCEGSPAFRFAFRSRLSGRKRLGELPLSPEGRTMLQLSKAQEGMAGPCFSSRPSAILILVCRLESGG